MKTKQILRRAATSAALALAAGLLANCAATSHPLARHDLDGDGQISDAEYRQANVRYNLASRERVDEGLRARSVTRHVFNVRDALAGASDAVRILDNFGR